MDSTESGPVARTYLVTGANGFIGSQLAALLLSRGHHVRGTVRRLDDPATVAHLRALPGAADRLELVTANLTEPGSFDEAVVGMEGVFHVASPYTLTASDPQRDLVDPAVQGSLNLLRAASTEPSVKRVVLTSSMAAVLDEPMSDHVYTEADWNTASSLSRNPYYFSKAQAERAAWQFVEETQPGFDLVCINPMFTIGPALGPGTNVSNQLIVDLMKGTYPGLFALSWGIVDVRDVALAHLLAMETPDASGRYMCLGEVVTMREAVDILRPLAHGRGKLPTRSLESPLWTVLVKVVAFSRPAGERSYLRTHLGGTLRVDTSRITSGLGMSFRPARSVLADTFADLDARGELPS